MDWVKRLKLRISGETSWQTQQTLSWLEGILVKHIDAQPPEPKTNTVDVPGADGIIDLTEANGAICYHNRSVIIQCKAYQAGNVTAKQCVGNLIRMYHGLVVDIMQDGDSEYFRGRLTVESDAGDLPIRDFEIHIDAEPYKYLMSNPVNKILKVWTYSDSLIEKSSSTGTIDARSSATVVKTTASNYKVSGTGKVGIISFSLPTLQQTYTMLARIAVISSVYGTVQNTAYYKICDSSGNELGEEFIPTESNVYLHVYNNYNPVVYVRVYLYNKKAQIISTDMPTKFRISTQASALLVCVNDVFYNLKSGTDQPVIIAKRGENRVMSFSDSAVSATISYDQGVLA